MDVCVSTTVEIINSARNVFIIRFGMNQSVRMLKKTTRMTKSMKMPEKKMKKGGVEEVVKE